MPRASNRMCKPLAWLEHLVPGTRLRRCQAPGWNEVPGTERSSCPRHLHEPAPRRD